MAYLIERAVTCPERSSNAGVSGLCRAGMIRPLGEYRAPTRAPHSHCSTLSKRIKVPFCCASSARTRLFAVRGFEHWSLLFMRRPPDLGTHLKRVSVLDTETILQANPEVGTNACFMGRNQRFNALGCGLLDAMHKLLRLCLLMR